MVFSLPLLVGTPSPALAQDESTPLAGLTVSTGEAPAPAVGQGAPQYSVEQTGSAVCEATAKGAAAVDRRRLERAHQATVAARQSRLDVKAGRIDARQAEAAELARQAAVRAVTPRAMRGQELPKPEQDALIVEMVSRERVLENGVPVLVVSGAVRNTGARGSEAPAVTIWTLDGRDFVLAAQSADIGGEPVAPGERRAFTLRLKNPPQYMSEVRLTFAPPFQYRTLRGCDLDGAAAAAGDGPSYTPAELAGLAQIAMLDASTAFAEAEIRKTPGGDNDERPARCDMASWRDLLRYADLMDEAATAARAAEVARRDAARGVFTPGEVESAERARETAVERALSARPPLAGEKARPVRGVQIRIERENSAVRLRGEADTHNPVYLLTVRDRFGRVASEVFIRMNLAGRRQSSAARPDGVYPFVWEIDFAPGLAHEVSLGAC